MRLQNKTALVTGSGRGIGRSIAELFSKEGAKVAINFNTAEQGALSLAEDIRKWGGEALVVRANVAKADEVNEMVKKTAEQFGRIDILVNNAGVIDRVSFLNSTEEIWDRAMEVNLKGAFLCAQAAAPIMLNQKRGKIINISSISGLSERSAVYHTCYTASKAGLIGLTRSLAVNLGPHINVNAICPGFTDTDMTSCLSNEVKKMRIEDTPLKRSGKPEEIAYAAVFLASDESDFITGEIITVSGGRGIR